MKVFLGEAFPSVWVVGEMHRIRPSSRGHLYFELVEKGAQDDIVGRLEGVIFRADLQRVKGILRRSGMELEEGRDIRCRGSVDVFPQTGRLQLVVRDVDPVFALGSLERRRREVLAALETAGLLERNRALPMPSLPLRVGLVTSAESAAYHDFVSSLRASAYAFQIVLAPTPVQGQGAEAGVAAALDALRRARVSCAVIVRGGGARADLQIFDSRAVAEAIARAPFPVLTGLGHETDQSIADRVAHQSFKTPTMAAEFLVARITAADARVAALERALARAARLPIARSQLLTAAIDRRLRVAGGRVVTCGRRLEELAARAAAGARVTVRAAERQTRETRARLERAAGRSIEKRRPLPAALAGRLAARVAERVRERSARLAALERLAVELGPERTLRRGFSITRTADGALVRDASRVALGQRVSSRLASGRIESIVERVDASGAADAGPTGHEEPRT